MQVDVRTLDAGSAGTIELSDEIFGLEPRGDILHRMVRYQQLKKMSGTHHSKDRSQIRTTGKKMYRQKGSGSARHGNKAAPQFRGGGKAHGPKPRSHAIDLPKKVRQLALRHALSSKVKNGGADHHRQRHVVWQDEGSRVAARQAGARQRAVR
jgi:large subunit ribosomal protein L4